MENAVIPLVFFLGGSGIHPVVILQRASPDGFVEEKVWWVKLDTLHQRKRQNKVREAT